MRPLLLALLLSSITPAQEPPAAASDPELLEPGAPRPVFVRMRAQLLPRAGALADFAKRHGERPRRELRRDVRAQLQERAEHSWEQVESTVTALQEAGHLGAALQRFWIVNGFAATADAEAVKTLSTLPAVEFVHRQRQPGKTGQHEFRPRDEAFRRRAERDLDRALTMREAARPEPPFDPERATVAWNLEAIRAPAAWRSGAHGKGVTIAMIDSGLLMIEPVVRALWTDPGDPLDGEDNDGDGFVDEQCGWDATGDTPLCVGDGRKSHGTMCAGILVGRGAFDDHFTTGVAPRAELMVLRGAGRLRAYEFLASHEADVLSMSFMWVDFELGSYRSVLRTAHEHLAACGVVAVGGAGNYGERSPPGKQIAFPKDIPCVIAAAGVYESGEIPAFSSRGPVTWELSPWYADHPASSPLEKPDVTGCIGGFPIWHWLSMPGRKVELERALDDRRGLITGPRGNSFSGPHAGGVAALMLSVAPDLHPWDIQRLMRATCKDLLEPGYDIHSGAGMLRADAAVHAARELANDREQ